MLEVLIGALQPHDGHPEFFAELPVGHRDDGLASGANLGVRLKEIEVARSNSLILRCNTLEACRRA